MEFELFDERMNQTAMRTDASDHFFDDGPRSDMLAVNDRRNLRLRERFYGIPQGHSLEERRPGFFVKLFRMAEVWLPVLIDANIQVDTSVLLDRPFEHFLGYRPGVKKNKRSV
jgi:hypothetical protein